MSRPHYLVGYWQILDCSAVSLNIDTKGIKGTIFHLCKTGEVTWKVPDEAASSPLFKCDTYEIVTKLSTSDNVIFRFGTYKGQIIDCLFTPLDSTFDLASVDDGQSLLLCKKCEDEIHKDPFAVPFSLLLAFQDSYFSDLTIKASNNKEFRVHSCILNLSAPEINWSAKPARLSNLTEDVLGTILHFLYGHCLPKGLKEDTIREVMNVASEIAGLETLISLCQVYMRNTTVKDQIFTLLSDLHACADQIIENFNNSSDSNNYLEDPPLDPCRLCIAVKNSIQEAAVAASKILMICDLYMKQKHELPIEDEIEIFDHMKSRVPFFVHQLGCFLQGLEVTASILLPSQWQELARYLVPEMETIFDTALTLLIKVKTVLVALLAEINEMEEKRSSQNAFQNLEQFTENFLCRKQETALRRIILGIINVLVYLHQKKENFKAMTREQKIRSVAKDLEELVEELPFFMSLVNGFTSDLEDELEWNDHWFWFKSGISKVSNVIKKLMGHRESLKEVLEQVAELIQRDSFVRCLVAVGLMDPPGGGADERPPEGGGRIAFERYPHSCDVRNSICVPPPAHFSRLSEASSDLLKSGRETDMTFEIITSGEPDEVPDRTGGVSPEPKGEAFKFAAHRTIVAARCDWFRKALLSGMQEDINRKIRIHDTSPHLFSLFLEYLYSGRLDCSALTSDQISELLLLSDRYEMDSLKQVCEHALAPHFDGDSVLYFFHMADRFHAKTLKVACEEFMAQHPEVLEAETFRQLPENLQSQVYAAVTYGKPPKIVLDVTADITFDASEILKRVTNIHINSSSSSPDSEDWSVDQDSSRLETALEQLRKVVGPGVSRSQLIPVILAADYDLNRALNFYYLNTF